MGKDGSLTTITQTLMSGTIHICLVTTPKQTILTGHKTRDIRSPTLKTSQDEHLYSATQEINVRTLKRKTTRRLLRMMS